METIEKGKNNMYEKLLTLAKEPEGNPENLDFKRYTLPLIGNDYPAKTAIMWNQAYKTFGIEAGSIMVVGKPEEAPEILDTFRKDPKYLGGGAGVGFKDEAIKFLDELDSLAEAIGSVNLIQKLPDNRLKGWNTDGLGYAESLVQLFKKQGEDLVSKKIVMLGAGGTCMSVAFALAAQGANLVILNRTVSVAQTLCERINTYVKREACLAGGEEDIAKEVMDADVVLNTSSKGERGDLENYSSLAKAVLPATPENIKANHKLAEKVMETLSKETIISDVVLRKSEMTPLIASAKENGFTTLDGVPMVVNQAIKAFIIIHKKEMEEKGITEERLSEVMKKAAGI